MQQTQPNAPKISALAIYISFSRIALCSFGSPPFWARRELVERKHWLTDEEFLELMALGQLLPGANVLNVLVMAGYRFGGWAGAAAAIAGFVGWPFLIVISLGALHQRYGGLPMVHDALIGMSAVAAGMLVASGVKMAAVLPKRWRPWLVCVIAFVSVGVLRWPLILVLAVLAPYSIVMAMKGRD